MNIIPEHSFPFLTGKETLAERDKKIMQHMLVDSGGWRLIDHAISESVSTLCSHSEQTKKVCAVVAKISDTVVKDTIATGKNIVKIGGRFLPEDISKNISKGFSKLLKIPEIWEKKYQIPQDHTAAILSATLFSLPVLGPCKIVRISKTGAVWKGTVKFLKEDAGSIPLLPKKIPRSMSDKQMKRLAKDFGFKEIPGGKGSHTKMVQGSETIIIPKDKDLSPIVKKTCFQALSKFAKKTLPITVPFGIEQSHASTMRPYSFTREFSNETGSIPFIQSLPLNQTIPQITEIPLSANRIDFSIPNFKTETNGEKLANLTQKVSKILPRETEVSITHPECLKKTTLTVSHPIGDVFKAGLSVTPKHIGNTSLSLSKDLPKSSSLGLSLCPLHPKESRISLTTKITGVSGNIVLNPLKPKHSQIQLGGELKKVTLGYSFPLTKPLQGRVSLAMPLSIYGIPVTAGINVSLRKPLNSHLKLSLPLPGINIPIVSLSPKSIVKTPQIVFNSIKGLFRKKHKKKQPKLIAPAQQNSLQIIKPADHLKLKQLCKQLNTFQWGQFDQKIAKANEILKIKPDHAGALWLRGHAYYYKKEYQLSYNDLFLADKLNPNNVSQIRYLGFCCEAFKERTLAIQYFGKAEKLAPANYAIKEDFARTYYAMDNFAKSIEYSNKAIQLDSKKAATTTRETSQKLQKLAQELNSLQWGQFDQKIAKANEILKIKPDHAGALWLRGHAYYYKKEYQLSYNDLFLVNELSPNKVHHLRYLGFCFEAFREYAQAIKYFEKAEKLAPADYAIKEDFARTYYAMDNFAKSIEYSNKAIQLDLEKSKASQAILADSKLKMLS